MGRETERRDGAAAAVGDTGGRDWNLRLRGLFSHHMTSEGRGGAQGSKLGKRAATDGWGRDPIGRAAGLAAPGGARRQDLAGKGLRVKGNRAGSEGLIPGNLRVVNVKRRDIRRTRTRPIPI